MIKDITKEIKIRRSKLYSKLLKNLVEKNFSYTKTVIKEILEEQGALLLLQSLLTLPKKMSVKQYKKLYEKYIEIKMIQKNLFLVKYYDNTKKKGERIFETLIPDFDFENFIKENLNLLILNTLYYLYLFKGGIKNNEK